MSQITNVPKATKLGLVLEKLEQQLNETLQNELLKKYDTLVTFAECELQSINTQSSD